MYTIGVQFYWRHRGTSTPIEPRVNLKCAKGEDIYRQIDAWPSREIIIATYYDIQG